MKSFQMPSTQLAFGEYPIVVVVILLVSIYLKSQLPEQCNVWNDQLL